MSKYCVVFFFFFKNSFLYDVKTKSSMHFMSQAKACSRWDSGSWHRSLGEVWWPLPARTTLPWLKLAQCLTHPPTHTHIHPANLISPLKWWGGASCHCPPHFSPPCSLLWFCWDSALEIQEITIPSTPVTRGTVRTSGYTNSGSDPCFALNRLCEEEHSTSSV